MIRYNTMTVYVRACTKENKVQFVQDAALIFMRFVVRLRQDGNINKFKPFLLIP